MFRHRDGFPAHAGSRRGRHRLAHGRPPRRSGGHCEAGISIASTAGTAVGLSVAWRPSQRDTVRALPAGRFRHRLPRRGDRARHRARAGRRSPAAVATRRSTARPSWWRPAGRPAPRRRPRERPACATTPPAAAPARARAGSLECFRIPRRQPLEPLIARRVPGYTWPGRGARRAPASSKTPASSCTPAKATVPATPGA